MELSGARRASGWNVGFDPYFEKGIKMSIETFFGMKIVQSPLVTPVPVLQLSPTFEWCSDKFRREFNAWMLEMFGTKEVVYMAGKDTVIMSPKQFAILKLQGSNMKLTGGLTAERGTDV